MTEEKGCCSEHSEEKSSEGKCCQTEGKTECCKEEKKYCTDDSCDCEHKEPMSTEELANSADDKADALINLLIDKGLISEGDFQKALDDLYEQ